MSKYPAGSQEGDMYLLGRSSGAAHARCFPGGEYVTEIATPAYVDMFAPKREE